MQLSTQPPFSPAMMVPDSTSATSSIASGFDTYLIADRKRYHLLQLAHGDNVIILRDGAIIRHLSASARRTLGVRATHGLSGQSVFSLLYSKDMLNTRIMLERVEAGYAPALEWVTRLRTGDRWEWFKLRATRFHYADEVRPVVAIFLAPLAYR